MKFKKLFLKIVLLNSNKKCQQEKKMSFFLHSSSKKLFNSRYKVKIKKCKQ